MVTSSTCPTRAKASGITCTAVHLRSGNDMSYDLRITDTTGTVVTEFNQLQLVNSGASDGIGYSAAGVPIRSTAIVVNALTTAFTTFTSTAGNFAAKTDAMLAGLQTAGLIPT